MPGFRKAASEFEGCPSPTPTRRWVSVTTGILQDELQRMRLRRHGAQPIRGCAHRRECQAVPRARSGTQNGPSTEREPGTHLDELASGSRCRTGEVRLSVGITGDLVPKGV